MKKYLTNSSLETKSLGAKFAKTLKEGDVVLLYGDLGSGKTTFIQGLAKGLGIKERILSPTFVLIKQHEIPHSHPLLKGERDDRKSSRQARTGNLYHVDLYRIHKQTDIVGLGLDEIINEKGSITIIEWADRLFGLKLKKNYKIYFKYLNSNSREITIKDYGQSR